jgi:hypothetical protein
MGLTIQLTDARIGIETTPSRLEMQSQAARLELNRKNIQLNIHTELPRVEIDQSSAFASAGLKNFIEVINEAAQIGYQQVMEYIGKTAEDGDRLAAIELGGNPIADIAERDAFPQREFNGEFSPVSGPQMTAKGMQSFDPDPLNGSDFRNAIQTTVFPSKLSINYTLGQIRIFPAQYSSIKMKYQPGKTIDVHI